MGERANQSSDEVQTDEYAQLKGISAADFKYDKATGTATGPNGLVVQEEFGGWSLQDASGMPLGHFDKATGHWTGTEEGGQKVNVDDKVPFKPDPAWFDPDAWTADGKLKPSGGETQEKAPPRADTGNQDGPIIDEGGKADSGGGGKTVVKPDVASAQDVVGTGVAVPPLDYTTIGPLDHKRPQGTEMADPNDHCIACGRDLARGSTRCDSCGNDFVSWNNTVTEFTENMRKAGASDKQIQDAWDASVGQWKIQGMQQDFLSQLDEADYQKLMDEIGE